MRYLFFIYIVFASTFALSAQSDSGAQGTVDAGLIFPNRLFLVDSTGRPITGFYNEKGERCLLPGRTPSQQLALYDALAIPAGVDRTCRFLVRAALETRCPQNSGGGLVRTVGPGVAGIPTTPAVLTDANNSTVVRCTAASDIRVHLDVTDVADPNNLRNMKKISFRRANSLNDPRLPGDRSSGQMLVPSIIDMQTVISQKFAACPPGYVNNGGVCELN